MFTLFGFGLAMGHYQNNFQKYNDANGKNEYNNDSHKRQSHYKERVKPQFVKASRRALRDDDYLLLPHEKKDNFHGKRKPFHDQVYHKNQPFHHHRNILNNHMEEPMMFNVNPSFHKFR